MEPTYKTVVDETKEVNEEERSITHWISTETLDRQGDIVRSKGMDDENYAKNPVVLWAHEWRGLPVGKSLWRKKSERGGIKGVLAKTQFADTEAARQVFDLWKGGFLNSASIGLHHIEREPMKDEKTGAFLGYEIKKWELLEYSIVPVPANQEALRLMMEKDLLTKEVRLPLEDYLMKSRVCELEACKAKMEAEIGNFALKTDFEVLNSVIGERITKLEEKIQTILSEIEKPKAETIVRNMTTEDLFILQQSIANGVVSQIKGKR